MEKLKIHSVPFDATWELPWKAWELAKFNYRLSLGLSLLYFALTMLGFIPLIGPLFGAILSALLPIVFLTAAKHWENGTPSSLSEILNQIQREGLILRILPLLVFGFIIAAVAVVLGALLPQSIFLLVSLALMPFGHLITLSFPIMLFNPEVNVFEAFELAIKGALQNFISLLILGVMMAVLAVLTTVLFFIPFLLVWVPTYFTVSYLWYRVVYEGLKIETDSKDDDFI